MLARVRNVGASDYQICFRDSVSAVNVKIQDQLFILYSFSLSITTGHC